jgi:hypothetical protein
MSWFGIMGLFKQKGRDIRLEADERGLRWVYISGENWASRSSLALIESDPRLPSVIRARLTGSHASHDVVGDGTFTVSSRALAVDPRTLLEQINGMRELALSRCRNNPAAENLEFSKT